MLFGRAQNYSTPITFPELCPTLALARTLCSDFRQTVYLVWHLFNCGRENRLVFREEVISVAQRVTLHRCDVPAPVCGILQQGECARDLKVCGSQSKLRYKAEADTSRGFAWR